MVDLSSLEGINQNYFSPFLIFIKGATALPDKELLKLIHLDKYETVSKANKNQIAKNSKGYLFVAKNNGWVYILDDWSYSLWYDKEVRENLRSLSIAQKITSAQRRRGFKPRRRSDQRNQEVIFSSFLSRR